MTNPTWVVPTIAQFQAQFFRDFPYASTQNPSLANDTSPETLRKYIINPDIQNAINEANADFNPGLFGSNNTLIFLYLAAHVLVESIRNSGMGLGSIAKWPCMSGGVGGVSVNNALTSKLIDDPNFAKYLTTGYGKKYVSLVYPYTIGAGISIIPGTTTSA